MSCLANLLFSTASLLNDAQGKTHGQAMLLLELDIPDNLLEDLNG